MRKQEFLDELKAALVGEVPPEAMLDSYRYYDAYIDEYVSKGQTEEQVIEQLGKPTLIARSIIDAQIGDRAADEEYTEDGRTRKIRSKGNTYDRSGFAGEPGSMHKEFHFNPSAWYAKLLYLLVFGLLVMLVFCILKGIFWIFFTFGIPILILLGIFYLIMYFMGGGKI